MKCIYGKTVEILQDEAGYFVGTQRNGKAYCRVSGHFSTEEEAHKVFEKYHISQCAENYRCSQEDGQYRI